MQIQVIDWEESVARMARKLEAGAVAVEETAPVFGAIATDMFRVEKAIFSSQGRRFGSSWKYLAESTRLKKGHPVILVDTGDLRRSVTEPGAEFQILQIDRFGIDFGTHRPWAFVHQFGDKRGHVPKRQFIDFNQRDLLRWTDMLFDHLLRPFRT